MMSAQANSNSDCLEITDATGELFRVEKSGIDEIQVDPGTAMPGNIAELLTLRQFHDLVAYLLSLGGGAGGVAGELPTDEDLFRTVTRGIPGTAMPEWEPYLSEAERWQVVRYIQSFAFEFADPEFDPYKKQVAISEPIPPTAESIARGREVFQEAKCFECHGQEGRGDGQKSAGMEDDWGYPLRIRNLTKGWTLKGGTEPVDIFTRFTSGINGTPMPSFAKTISEQNRWHLANYISREVVVNPTFERDQVEAMRVEGALPSDPWSTEWDQAGALDVPMAGQLLVRPRWQNHAVEMVTLKALYNDDEIAFLVIWDDPFEDRTHLWVPTPNPSPKVLFESPATIEAAHPAECLPVGFSGNDRGRWR